MTDEDEPRYLDSGGYITVNDRVIDTEDVTLTLKSNTDDESAGESGDPNDALGIPECPECGVQDAVQIATREQEWVCQNNDCNEVYTP